MIELKLPREVTWLNDVAPGLHLQVRPLTMAIWSAALASMKAEAGKLAEAKDEVEKGGGSVVGLEDMTDPHLLEGKSRELFAVALGQYAIVGWEGVAADGEPAEVTPENVADLLRLGDIGERFLQRYSAQLDEVWSEGNGSGAAPNGTSATAPATARGAKSKASPAPAAGRA